MNDELELIEEFQSDSIDELVSERKKNKAVQIFMMQPFPWFCIMNGATLMIN